jgi:hypothetical protein
MAYLGWLSKPQLIRSFVQESLEKIAIRHMTCYVDRFGLEFLGPMLIKHNPSNLNKDPILVFNNAILLRYIQIHKQMLKTQRSTKGFKNNILQYYAFHCE